MNDTIFEREELAKAVLEIIKNFLMSNGGMANGYSTWMEGEVREGFTGGPLKWSTPVIDKLTGEVVKNMAFEVHKKLYNLVFNKFEYKGTVRIVKEHIEYGCCRTSIELVDTYTCNLR